MGMPRPRWPVADRSVLNSDWLGLVILGIAAMAHGPLIFLEGSAPIAMLSPTWGTQLVLGWQVACFLSGVCCLVGASFCKGLAPLVAVTAGLFTLWGLLNLIGWLSGYVPFGYAVALPYLVTPLITGWAYARGHPLWVANPRRSFWEEQCWM